MDEAITALLRQKQALFDEYADRSAAGDAQTRTEQEWITRTVAGEQARLGLVPHRKPLLLPTDPTYRNPPEFLCSGGFFDAEFSTKGRGKSGKLPETEPSAAGSGKKRKFPSCNSAEKLL